MDPKEPVAGVTDSQLPPSAVNTLVLYFRFAPAGLNMVMVCVAAVALPTVAALITPDVETCGADPNWPASTTLSNTDRLCGELAAVDVTLTVA